MSYRDREPSPRPSVRKFMASYAPDWIVSIVLWLVFFVINTHVSGFKREFSMSDVTLRYPYAVHQRVSNFALYIICAFTPFVCQIAINLLTVRSWWDFHHSTLGLLLGLSMTGSLTQLVKVTVGRPRPDVISRCQPPVGSVDPPLGLSTVAICTQTNLAILNDGWRSFPSGHSSMAFAGLGFLSFYLAGKVHLFDTRGHASKAWLALTPLTGAALVAISRTMDYRHHWQDVVTGSILGIVVSLFAYRQYYPSLASVVSHRPYATRFTHETIQGNQNGRLTRQNGNRYQYIDEEDEVSGSDHGIFNGMRKSDDARVAEAE